MKKKWLISLACAAVLAVSIAVLLLARCSPGPAVGGNTPTTATEKTEDPTDGNKDPSVDPTDPSDGVTEPSQGNDDPAGGEDDPAGGEDDPAGGEDDPAGGEDDPADGEDDPAGGEDDPTDGEDDPEPDDSEALRFPYEIPDYKLVVEKMAPYTGMFVEDGTNAPVENVAMLLVHNQGDLPVEYAQICVKIGTESLVFEITALPVGARMVVQEKTAKAIPAGSVDNIQTVVAQRTDMAMASQVQVTDNGDNTLTVRNLTDEMIPTVRVFYKYYMEAEGVYVGGIAFTVRIHRLEPGGAITLQPSHYTSATSRVVMVLTYDSEV